MAPSLQTLAASQLSVKTLTQVDKTYTLPSLLIRSRAATVIQTAYRAVIVARKQRLQAEVKKLNDHRESWEKNPWEMTGRSRIGVASGWMQLQKWDYVDDDFNTDYIYCNIRYHYNKKSRRLVVFFR